MPHGCSVGNFYVKKKKWRMIANAIALFFLCENEVQKNLVFINLIKMKVLCNGLFYTLNELVKENKNRVRLIGLGCFFTRRYGRIVQVYFGGYM